MLCQTQKCRLDILVRHTRDGRAPALPQDEDVTNHQVQEERRQLFETAIHFSDLCADTKEMQPASPREADRLSGEPN